MKLTAAAFAKLITVWSIDTEYPEGAFASIAKVLLSVKAVTVVAFNPASSKVILTGINPALASKFSEVTV